MKIRIDLFLGSAIFDLRSSFSDLGSRFLIILCRKAQLKSISTVKQIEMKNAFQMERVSVNRW